MAKLGDILTRRAPILSDDEVSWLLDLIAGADRRGGRRMQWPGAPDSVTVTLNLKFLQVGGTWTPNDEERRAAWELYIELITRIGVVPLRDGLSREALTSFYSIFGTTREILRRYGPRVAERRSVDELNFGYLAVALLNQLLRPVLSFWHPQLLDWEERLPEGQTRLEHERAWPRDLELRGQLEDVGVELRYFVNVLATVCGIPDIAAPPQGG